MAAKRNTLSVIEAAQHLGIGVGFAYLLVRSGRLKAERVDGRWQVDPASVEGRLKRLRARYEQLPARKSHEQERAHAAA